MIAQLIAAGVFAAGAPSPATRGPVNVPAERTARVARIQAATASIAGIPHGAVEWQQPYDPADHAPYAFDFSDLFEDGEKIDDILALRLSASAAALGIIIDTAPSYGPVIDNVDGTKAMIWFVVSGAQQESASFTAAGVKVAVTMKVSTTSTPSKTYERTCVLTVRQL